MELEKRTETQRNVIILSAVRAGDERGCWYAIIALGERERALQTAQGSVIHRELTKNKIVRLRLVNKHQTPNWDTAGVANRATVH